MNTEKKAKIAIFVGFIIIVTSVLLGASYYMIGNAEAEEITNPTTIPVEQVTDQLKYEFPTLPYQEEGYSDLKTYWEDLTSKRASFEGISAQVQEELAGYLSEEDIAKLDELESKLVKSSSIQQLNEYEAQLNEIVNTAQTAKETALTAQTTAYSTSSGGSVSYGGNYDGSYYDFLRAGIVYHNGNKFSYYSQSVLPGGGLNIPGRHTDGGFVRDGDGYICVANDAPIGSVISTPWGDAKVYDRGTSGNHYDVYVE